MKNKNKILISAVTALTMSISAFSPSFSVAADNSANFTTFTVKDENVDCRYIRYKDQNLGDDGTFFADPDSDETNEASWNTINYDDKIEILFEDFVLSFIENHNQYANNATNDNANFNRERYIFRQLSNGKWKKSKNLHYANPNSLEPWVEYTDTGLKPATKYNYKILIRLKNNPDARLLIKFSTMTTPKKVTNVTGHASTTAVRLNWKKEKCSGYKIQQYNAKEKEWKNIKLVNKNSTTTRISGLNSGKRYKFRVVAYSKLKNTKIYKKGKWVKGSETYHAKPSKTITLTTKK